VILTETAKHRAIEVAERIRASVENASFSSAGERVSSTISVGVSCFAGEIELGDEIVARADRKLYESKRKGKNTVSY
jgi:diguanylate cyclase (GGDEF)-like protein